LYARDQDKIVYSISPINRRPNRKNESGVGTVPPYVHRPLIRAMARVVGYG